MFFRSVFLYRLFLLFIDHLNIYLLNIYYNNIEHLFIDFVAGISIDGFGVKKCHSTIHETSRSVYMFRFFMLFLRASWCRRKYISSS